MAGPGKARAGLARIATRIRARGGAEVLGWALANIRTALWSNTEIVFFSRPGGGKSAPRPDVRCRPARTRDAARFAAEIGTDSASTFRARLSRGQACYLVEEASRLLHSSWVTRAPVWMAETRHYVGPPPGAVYVFESFTRTQDRGRGVFSFTLETISSDLKDEVVWIAALANNAPSIRAIEKAGFRAAFTVRVWRKFGRVRLEIPNKGEPFFGSSAEDARGP